MQVIDHHRTGRIGLALAGGGPEGAVYEIGALRALDDALDGVDFNAFPVTVGVSAGAFVGACLANGITTAQLVRSVVHDEASRDDRHSIGQRAGWEVVIGHDDVQVGPLGCPAEVLADALRGRVQHGRVPGTTGRGPPRGGNGGPGGLDCRRSQSAHVAINR